MASKSKRSARVWLHGEPVGEIEAPSPTTVTFRYDDAAIAVHGLNAPLLSCSLPTSRSRRDGRAFFAGLLPEGDHRRALASRAGVLDTHVLALLQRYGQDVAGAVVIGDEVATRSDAYAEPYTTTALEQEIVDLAAHVTPLAVHDDSELSIAGLQDKMLLVRMPDGRWGRPVHGYPSTHILKIDDRTHRNLVVAEHACLELATAAGISAARSQLIRIADADCLVVERFDRKEAGRRPPSRIHQEDSCQALGVDLERTLGRGKYEEHGGPSLRDVARVLSRWGIGGLEELLEHVTFTVLIGNADAHGKNIAFLHQALGEVRLAPLYDPVPTGLWPTLRTRAAMSVGGVVDLPHITADDIVTEARTWGMPEATARPTVRECIERVLEAVATIAPADAEVAERTLKLVAANARRLLST